MGKGVFLAVIQGLNSIYKFPLVVPNYNIICVSKYIYIYIYYCALCVVCLMSTERD